MIDRRGWDSRYGRYGAVAVLLGAVGAGLPAGCQKTAQPGEAGATNGEPVVREADRGPIKLTVTADRGKLSIAERLKLAVVVEADAGIEVRMPEFGVQMSEFQIRDFQEPLVEESDGGRRRYQQVYDLDIFLSGEYTIPAITVKYRQRPTETAAADRSTGLDDEEADYAELSTESFPIEVTSLLEGEFDPEKFRDVKPVAALTADRRWGWLAWTGGAVGAAALAVAGVVLWRRRRQSQPVIVIPPHEWAFQQLRQLADAGLVEAGRVKEFYYRLSEIARVYIELRFGLMAPERTTEEFLEEMHASGALPVEYQAPLGRFLEACDLVKYARYEPAAEEIEQVFNAARDFVERTKPSAAPSAGDVFREAAA